MVVPLYYEIYMLRPPLQVDEDWDELFKNAVELVVEYDKASPALLQRRLSIGYARAARLVDQLEAAGVVGPAAGAKPREVLIHSSDELFTEGREPQNKEQEENLNPPANYKVPVNIKLSKVDKTPWGKQLSEVIKAKDYQSSKTDFPILLGYDDESKLHIESLLDVKNLIVTGNPLSQKEILIDTILLTFLLRHTPHQLRFILIDPTHYLDLYNGLPHFLTPVISDYSKVVSALRWSQSEMERRMKLFAQAGVRDIQSFNQMSGFDALPRILIITFYKFPDMETEDAMSMLAAEGARAGIHSIIVVDRTSGKSLPNRIKSSVPARVVCRLSSTGESKAIDVSGAENLQPGEIIYKPNFGRVEKLKAIFTPEANVREVVAAVKDFGTSSS